MKKEGLHALPGPLRALLSFVFWIAVWWVLALIVRQEVLIPSPPVVAVHLWSLLKTAEFYLSVLFSVLRVTAGFSAGVLLGILCGILCARFKTMDTLLSPFLSVVRATPVASFIILALVWLNRDLIPVAISALMVLPVVFGNVLEGIRGTDRNLLEMAKVFRFRRAQVFGRIYVPSVLPYLSAGMRTGIGLAWKAGVAAEVLCLAADSIGKNLYQSKLYLETADMFAWTFVVILLSILIEKLLMTAVGRLGNPGAPVAGKSRPKGGTPV